MRAAKATPSPLPSASESARRRAPRLELEVEVDFTADTNFYTGFTENISSGGLFIATYQKLEHGQEISLSLTLPSEEVLPIKGRVCWCREATWEKSEFETAPGYGIEFEGLDAETEEAIQMFIELRAPLFFDND